MRLALLSLLLMSGIASAQEFSIVLRTNGMEYRTEGCWDLYSVVFEARHGQSGQVIGIGCTSVSQRPLSGATHFNRHKGGVAVSIMPGAMSMNCRITGHARLGGIGLRVYASCLDDPFMEN